MTVPVAHGCPQAHGTTVHGHPFVQLTAWVGMAMRAANGPGPGRPGPQARLSGTHARLSGPQTGVNGGQAGVNGGQAGVSGGQAGVNGGQPGVKTWQPGPMIVHRALHVACGGMVQTCVTHGTKGERHGPAIVHCGPQVAPGGTVTHGKNGVWQFGATVMQPSCVQKGAQVGLIDAQI